MRWIMSIKVMLTDDHGLVREGVRSLLESEQSIEVIAEAKDGIECLEKLRSVKPDILLLDINMPNMNGIETLEKIKKINSSLKVLILTMHSEDDYLIKAFNRGVDGYILKDSNSFELKKAIDVIMSGESYFQPNLIPIINSKMPDRSAEMEKSKALTKRELEILIQVAKGLLNKEIAINLNISERTVKNHISNIFKKIDVSDRTQAAIFAIKNGIVDLY